MHMFIVYGSCVLIIFRGLTAESSGQSRWSRVDKLYGKASRLGGVGLPEGMYALVYTYQVYTLEMFANIYHQNKYCYTI